MCRNILFARTTTTTVPVVIFEITGDYRIRKLGIGTGVFDRARLAGRHLEIRRPTLLFFAGYFRGIDVGRR